MSVLFCPEPVQLEVLELLVQNGADLNAQTKNHETPFGKDQPNNGDAWLSIPTDRGGANASVLLLSLLLLLLLQTSARIPN